MDSEKVDKCIDGSLVKLGYCEEDIVKWLPKHFRGFEELGLPTPDNKEVHKYFSIGTDQNCNKYLIMISQLHDGNKVKLKPEGDDTFHNVILTIMGELRESAIRIYEDITDSFSFKMWESKTQNQDLISLSKRIKDFLKR